MAARARLSAVADPALVCGLAACALGGCSLSPATSQRAAVAPAPAAVAPKTAAGPTASSTPATSSSATSTPATASLAQTNRTHEYPTPAPRQTVAGGWRSPVEAVEQFANYYINWTYETVVLHLRALSEVSVGQARAALTLQASETARDYELRRGEIVNRGVVEAIGPVTGRDGQYAVVTREQTTAAASSAYQGLAPAWHVAIATVTRVRGLWVLSAWQPEN